MDLACQIHDFGVSDPVSGISDDEPGMPNPSSGMPNLSFLMSTLTGLVTDRNLYLKGLRPLPPTPADSRIFGFLDFSKNVFSFEFSGGFWGLGGFAIDWKWLWASNTPTLSPNRAIWVHFQ